MRTNGEYSHSHAPRTGLSGILLSSEPNIPEGLEYEKSINTISMDGEKFYQLHTETTTAVATSKYSGETDPSEIERTYIIRKQLTRFY